jgi:hypothetical protein
VLLLGIFRRVPCPSDTRGALVLFYFPGSALPFKKKKKLKKQPSLKSIYDCTLAPHKQELGTRDYHLQIAVMVDGDDLYSDVFFFSFFSLPTSHFDVKIKSVIQQIK